MTNSALEVKNLTKDYGDFVLDKLNFTIPRGVIMGLIGENGAGKSTTINCILNEIQKDAGEILIFGKDHISNEIEIKTISPTFLLPWKLGNIWPGFTPVGNGLLTASSLRSSSCQKTRKSKIFQKE